MWNREHAHDVRHALFGGERAVRVWSLVAAPRRPFAAVLACELEPGGSVGAHVQAEFSELVIAIDGHGHVLVNGARSPLAPGAVIELPLGETLAIGNDSAERPLRYLIIKAH
jgi:quercetin dioxygenase-like cupin family protein